jgi:hypothetical protein
MIAVGEWSESAVQRNDLKVVFWQFQVANHLWPQQAHDIGANGVFKAGINLFGDGGAAKNMAAFENEDLLAGFGQISGSGKAVVAAADYESVILVVHRSSLLTGAFFVIFAVKSTR